MVRCDNEEEHFGHRFPREVEEECTGKTSCGMTLHKPHKIPTVIEVYCNGICNCGIVTYRHGPGQHK